MDTIKRYYSLTKPGVLYGNALTAAAGFLLASANKGRLDIGLFLALFAGTTLVIASACVFNNYLDQDIDKIMARTKKRALVEGTIKGPNAVIFATSLGIIGLLTLYLFTNLLVVIIGIIGFVDYVFLYGMLSKRLSVHGTLVGSISGAMPILAGYTAVTGIIDAGAIIVFLILFFWQMPEFYSISIYRLNEYKAAGIPVISVARGVEHTKKMILLYTFAFVISTLLLTAWGYTGLIYLIVMGTLGLKWLIIGISGFGVTDNDAWARKMFRFSLVMILALCLMLPVGAILP